MQWDFSARGRLFFLYNDVDQAMSENLFASMSELVRTGRATTAMLASTQEMVTISSGADSERTIVRYMPSTRSAQRGTDANYQLLKILLSTSKLRKPHLKNGLMEEQDEIHVLDVHTHAGDHCLASMTLQGELPNLAQVRHFLVELTSLKSSVQSVQWCVKRLGHWLAQRWLKHELKLEKDGRPISPDIDCQVT